MASPAVLSTRPRPASKDGAVSVLLSDGQLLAVLSDPGPTGRLLSLECYLLFHLLLCLLVFFYLVPGGGLEGLVALVASLE